MYAPYVIYAAAFSVESTIIGHLYASRKNRIILFCTSRTCLKNHSLQKVFFKHALNYHLQEHVKEKI